MDGTGSAGPAQPAPGCAPGCAAATVLLGIPGLLVTAVTETQDGQTLVEVITDPAAEAAALLPAVRHGGHPGQGASPDRAPRHVHRRPAGPAGLAQDPVALRHTGL